MEHIAIMKKSWGLTGKILEGKKTIESRWYKFRYVPWNKIKAGENIYFKDSGEPVTIKAKISKVLQFSNLDKNKIKEIIAEYGSSISGEQSGVKLGKYYKDKKYCILVFIKNPKGIKPFNLDKKGFGNMAAWISVKHVNSIKI